MHFAPRPYKSYDFSDPEIVVRSEVSAHELLVTLQAKKPAYFVALESNEPGHFDDSAFDLLADEPKVVRFTGQSKDAAIRAAASLIIRNLYSSTHT